MMTGELGFGVTAWKVYYKSLSLRFPGLQNKAGDNSYLHCRIKEVIYVTKYPIVWKRESTQ